MNKTKIFPAVLFVYKRFAHTKKTIEALLDNKLSSQTNLIVFSDGPRSDDEINSVQEVRNYLKSIAGFKSIRVIEREENLGLSENILTGVSDVLQDSEAVIVLEDDLVTSPYFLEYMNNALGKYFYEDRIASIHGYVYPLKKGLSENFFLRGADCWGWATWSNRWEDFDRDPKQLLKSIKEKGLLDDFNYDGCSPFLGMLEAKIEDKNDSWAILWHASNYLKGKLTLYPHISLVHNIGNDSSGEHSANTKNYDVVLGNTPLMLPEITIQESTHAKEAFKEYFKSQKESLVTRFIKKTKSLFY